MELFDVGEIGYVLTMRLVELRVQYDIRLESDLLRKAADERVDSFFEKVMSPIAKKQARDTASRLDRKKLWLELWVNQAKSAVSLHESLLVKSVDDLATEFRAIAENEPKLFLVLQMAVLTPLYVEMEEVFTKELAEGLSELNHDEGIEYISMRCSFPARTGKSIETNLHKTLRHMGDNTTKMVVLTLAGAVAMVMSAGLAAPVIATAIGGAMGLAGAAAGSAGLAFLGGGAVAAGGLGMAGGLYVLIGGGALLGATGGASVHKILVEIPSDQFSVQLALIANYVHYLSSDFTFDKAQARRTAEEVCVLFIEFKSRCEMEYLIHKAEKDSSKNINNLHTVFKNIARDIHSFYVETRLSGT